MSVLACKVSITTIADPVLDSYPAILVLYIVLLAAVSIDTCSLEYALVIGETRMTVPGMFVLLDNAVLVDVISVCLAAAGSGQSSAPGQLSIVIAGNIISVTIESSEAFLVKNAAVVALDDMELAIDCEFALLETDLAAILYIVNITVVLDKSFTGPDLAAFTNIVSVALRSSNDALLRSDNTSVCDEILV
jgi:hypothetical protein